MNGPDAPAALVGITLDGAYRITRPLGEGGMGAVYEAVQLRLNKRVAVKVMVRELASNAEALARFQREAEITSQLRHPHLVTVMDFGTVPTGQPYLVMEYLEGTDLGDRIRRLGRLPLETAVHIAKQFASALAAAHDQGVVHRDLKPENVFLVALPGEPDFVKILDFGISKVRAAQTQLTKASTIIGTPDYMAPEQATGMLDEIDHRTDQWALACIVWEMLSGRPPFAGDDVSAVFYQVIHLDPQPLGKRVPGLPPGVEAVLRQALSKNMTERYPSMRDFAQALEIAAFARPAEATPPPAQVPQEPPVPSRGGSVAPPRERRQAQRERRRCNPSTPSLGDAGEAALEDAVKVSFRRNLKPIAALSAVAVGLVLGAALFLRGAARPSDPVAPSVAIQAAGAKPSPTTPPVKPKPIAAAEAAASGQSKPRKLGLDEIAARPPVRASKQKPEAGKALVRDAADPFAPPRRAGKPHSGEAAAATADLADPFAPIRLASKQKAARARKGDSDFVDPFAP